MNEIGVSPKRANQALGGRKKLDWSLKQNAIERVMIKNTNSSQGGSARASVIGSKGRNYILKL